MHANGGGAKSNLEPVEGTAGSFFDQIGDFWYLPAVNLTSENLQI